MIKLVSSAARNAAPASLMWVSLTSSAVKLVSSARDAAPASDSCGWHESDEAIVIVQPSTTERLQRDQ